MQKLTSANVKKTIAYLKRNGLSGTVAAVWERLEKQEEYVYEAPSDSQLREQREWRPIGKAPLFTVVVPAYRTGPGYLCAMMDSVLMQSYENWELLIADASENRTVCDAYEDFVGGLSRVSRPDRILRIELSSNKGISENTNEALEEASGDYVVFLDHDDLLAPDALYEAAKRITESPRPLRMLYSDEDKCDERGLNYFEPNIKPDFDPELLLSNNYICHMLVMETELARSLRLRKEYDGAQDYDLILRAGETLSEEEIAHLPKVLYHWRCHQGSTAENPESKAYAYEAGRRALEDALDRRKLTALATVRETPHVGFYRIEYEADVFSIRRDLGVVGGRVLGHKYGFRVVSGGAVDAEGRILYEGLPAGHSGYLHRAVLPQRPAGLDLRCIRVAPKYRELFREVTGVPYTEDPETGRFAWKHTALASMRGFARLKLGILLCERIREEGGGVLYEPQWEERI
ncbi:MAG: glycosyltransferase [Lachnospiraceae bacterium]|nr:glycosyltransferase [Lachnospiraceae bacterium]